MDPATAEEITDVRPGYYKVLMGARNGDVIATEEEKLSFELLEKLSKIQNENGIYSRDLSCACGHNELAKTESIYPTTSSLKNPMVFEKSDAYEGELVSDLAMVIVENEDKSEHDYSMMPAQVYIDDKDRMTTLVSYYDQNADVWTGVLDRPAFIGNKEHCYGIFIPMTICPDQALFAANMLQTYAANITGEGPYYPRELPNARLFK